MKCRVCGKEIEEGSEFCKFCGASQKKKRKPSWRERKAARERETEEIIKKSYLTEQDVLLAVPRGTEGLELRYVGETQKVFVKSILFSIVYALASAAAVAGLVLMMRISSDALDRTLRAVICFALLLVLAGFGGALADKIYCARTFASMKKSERAVKKISYGKAPYLTNDGKLYQLVCNARCIACGAPCHIEEFAGRMYTVCDLDRTHLCVLSTDKIYKDLLGADTGEDEAAVRAEKTEEQRQGSAAPQAEGESVAAEAPENTAEESGQDKKTASGSEVDDTTNGEKEGAEAQDNA